MTGILACRFLPGFKMRVLLTGASGYVAGYLLRSIPADVRVIAAVHKQRPALTSVLAEQIPLDLKLSVGPQLENQKFDVVIHAGAMANLQECEKQPAVCKRINRDAARELAEYCSQNNIFLVFLSTDIVFSGLNAPYRSSDVPHPVNTYGRSKRQAEQALLSINGKTAILRLALLLGRGMDGASNFIDWFRGHVQSGQKVPLFSDEVRTPVWTEDAARAIWMVAQNKMTGIRHICGDRQMNRMELGHILINRMGGDPQLLQPVCPAKSTVKRPLDVSLLADKVIPAFSFTQGLKRGLNG